VLDLNLQTNQQLAPQSQMSYNRRRTDDCNDLIAPIDEPVADDPLVEIVMLVQQYEVKEQGSEDKVTGVVVPRATMHHACEAMIMLLSL
jgi:hypothetical protein